MSEQNTAWYHCGHCGSMFRALTGESLVRQCDECGRDPAIGTTVETGARPAANIPGARLAAQSTAGQEKRELKKRAKANLLPLKLVVAWLVLLGGIVWFFNVTTGDDSARPATGPAPAAVGQLTDEEVEFINAGAHGGHLALVGFLSVATHEARSQFVLQPAATVWKMTRFYSQNPIPTFDPAGLLHLRSDLVPLPDGRGVMTQWRTAESRQIETLVRQEGDEWLIDWEHFARYSDYPWALFLAGGGEAEGEFRLLARERLADDRGPGDPLSVVFHAPRFGEPDHIDRPSPEFILNPGSAMEFLLDEAFERRRSANEPTTAIAGDPPGTIRVRVVVRRTTEGDANRFELLGVRATDWRTPTPENPSE